MTVLYIRGLLRVTAAISGLLLMYGIVFAMEGLTTRIAISAVRELVITTLWMLPWMLLSCGGFDDFAAATKQHWLFWCGSSMMLVFIYYHERHTTSSGLTKMTMPLLVFILAVLPHVFPRISLVYTGLSTLGGVCGIVALYFVLRTFLSPKTSFANGAIASVIVAFSVSLLGAGILSVVPRTHRTTA